MKFRPCIDLHNGKVKQIVGGSLSDKKNYAEENFVSCQGAAFYGELYKKYNLKGGHIILLNGVDSEYYEEDVVQAKKALKAYPNGLQIGGGITDKNAAEFLEEGASHVIVTSFVFKDGRIHYENLLRLKEEIGKEKIVLDLSVRKKDGIYYIVTDRWQKFTKTALTPQIIRELSMYCDEYLIHAVDVEGKANGIELNLIDLLSQTDQVPITYAGGVSTWEDIQKLRVHGKGKIDVTIGSALDLFGGEISFHDLLKMT
ncbi:MAG: phosphoribosylformimino-5-aminoimidazole carboxamide ribotide isomerase [Acetivibrio sp.]